MDKPHRFVLPINSGAAKRSFVSRAGLKLNAAIETFSITVQGLVSADFGANVGGFSDCLLQHGAAKVYAVDTAYGVLAWALRKNPRIVVMERINALHVQLPEPVDLITIDTGWTRQEKILPHAATLLKPGGIIVTLIKPHYESEVAKLQHGVLNLSQAMEVLNTTLQAIEAAGFLVTGVLKSPLEGQKGNTEFVAVLRRGNPVEK